MTNMIRACDFFHEARVFIIHTRPDEILKGTAGSKVADQGRNCGTEIGADAFSEVALGMVVAAVQPPPEEGHPCVEGLMFRVQGWGFGSENLGWRVWVWGLGFWVLGFGFWVLRFGVWSSGSRV